MNTQSIEKLSRSRALYRELRANALEALTGEHPNAIWNQLARMIIDEVWFKAVIRIRERVGQPPMNPHLWNTFITGYAITQSLAIRRLTEGKEGVASLLAIVRKIKNNASLLTREVVVGHDGTSMDVAGLFEEMAHSVKYDEGGHTGKSDPIATQRWSDADHAHVAFDRLRDADMGAPRSPGDRISDVVLDRLITALTSDAIKRVRYQCDKYLAHADLSDLSGGLAGPTYNDIHESIQTLVEVKQFLCADFFNYSSGSVVPTYQGDQLADLSVPLVPPMPVETYREAWNEVVAEVEAWGDAEQFRRFNLHQSPAPR
ncbi:hypothetical protein P5Y53_04120 [Dyella jiangningensis]|uniref:AbiU2 domain-containing protein n=1 Tax=Dyella jiangningensis TaxID=1379159 RepID=UPI00240F61A6|nr:hypothetical protein [Dyella jiangningensis]MDG2536837.1 hypothetical protein [Dyella jiangningensis]